MDIVVYENVLLGGENTCYTGLDHWDQGLEGWGEGSVRVGGRDEDCFRCHEGGDGVKTGGAHGITGFNQIDCSRVSR